MAWKNSKTNWKAGDTPNSGDFNRIEENINYVKDNAGKVETVNNISPDSNKNITLTAGDIGAIKDNGRIVDESITINVGPTRTHKTVQSALNAMQKITTLNRYILIDEGTYNESGFGTMFHGAKLSIRGLGTVNLTSLMVDESSADITIESINITNIIRLDDCGIVKIANCRFTNPSTSDTGAVYVGSTRLYMLGNTISNKKIGVDIRSGTIAYIFSTSGTGNTTSVKCTDSIAFLDPVFAGAESITRGQVYK